jgi:hypothetical protein
MDPKESDDQVMINRECERLDTMMKLQVDVDGVVFKNVLYGIFNKTHKNEPYFISYPGSGGSTSFDSSHDSKSYETGDKHIENSIYKLFDIVFNHDHHLITLVTKGSLCSQLNTTFHVQRAVKHTACRKGSLFSQKKKCY